MNAVVIIPTYNERENLAAIVDAVLAHDGLRVLVVDDGSPDGTGQLADELCARYRGRLDVLHRTGSRGFGPSYRDGMRHALKEGADLVCQMDADFSHDPRYLPDMIAAAAESDLVLGSRYMHGISVVNWPLRRILLSVMANNYIRLVTRLPCHDCTSGFRVWRRETLEAVLQRPTHSDGYAFQFEMLFEAVRLGFSVTEVPIIFVERRVGDSKLSPGMLTEAVATPWRLILRRSASKAGQAPPQGDAASDSPAVTAGAERGKRRDAL